MFKHAVVRKPSPELAKGITRKIKGKVNFRKAYKQHEQYVLVLEKLGLDITVLEANSSFPDSVFVEDVAVCIPECAIITRPGALPRREETYGMETVLSRFYNSIEKINAPGTLDGGDVLITDSQCFVGISERTNQAGAEQLEIILKQFGIKVTAVSVKNMLHLKTGVVFLQNNNLLVNNEYQSLPEFEAFNKLVTPLHEAPAANCLRINKTVVVPAGYPVTKSKIENAGYPTIETDISEFEKLDGGLTCLSIRF